MANRLALTYGDPTYWTVDDDDYFPFDPTELVVPDTRLYAIDWQYSASQVDDYLASSDFFDLYPDYDIEPVWNRIMQDGGRFGEVAHEQDNRMNQEVEEIEDFSLDS